MNTEILLVVTIATKQQVGIFWMGVFVAVGFAFLIPALMWEIFGSRTVIVSKKTKKGESLPIGVVGNVQIVKPGMSKPGFTPVNSLKYGNKVIQRKKRGDEPVEVKGVESASIKGCVKIGIEGETDFTTSPSTYFLVYEGREESQKPASEIKPGMMIGGRRVGKVEVIEKEITVYCPLIEGRGGVKNVVLEVGKALVVCYAKAYTEDEPAQLAGAKKNGNGNENGNKSKPVQKPSKFDRGSKRR